MKRSIWMRVLAAVLIISMLAAPVSAVARNPKPSYGTNCIVGGIISIIRDLIRDIWDDWFDIPGDEDPDPSTPIDPTDPSEPGESEPIKPGETIPVEPEESPDPVLNLIEDHSNTVNGELLRGVTYSLGFQDKAKDEPQSAPRSLRNLKTLAISAAKAAVAPTAEGDDVVYGFRNWVNGGQYYIQNARAEYNNANGWLRAENNAIVGTDMDNATLFTLGFLDNGKYTLSYDDNGTTKYLYLNTTLADKSAMEGFSTTAQELTLERLQTGTVYHNGSVILEDDGHFIRIGSNGKYLCQHGGTTVATYGAEDSSGDSGNAMWFYQVQDGTTTKVTYGEIVPEEPVMDLELEVTARYLTNRLSWNAEDGVTYTVERSEDNETWTTCGTATTGSYLDETAGTGTQYYYRITTDDRHTAGVQSAVTGMDALKEIAVLFYKGNDATTFDGTNKEVIATGDDATALSAMQSGTIIYKANFENLSGVKAVLGTDTGYYVGSTGNRFRHELGDTFKGTFNNGTLTTGENTAGFVYDDTNGHWALCSNGDNVFTDDLNEANFGMLTATNATTYYAGGSSNNNHGFRGTINYIMVLSEVLTDAELRALTAANKDHDEVDEPEEAVDLVYFPVTMFNYDTDALNTATHIAELEWARETETEITEWKGIYFSDGTPAAGYNGPTGEYTEGWTVTYELVTPTIVDGNMTNLEPGSNYILVNKRSGRAVAIGDCQRVTNNQSGNKANLHLVDSPDLGLGTDLSSAPATITMSYTAEDADSSFVWNYYTDDNHRHFKAGNDEYLDYTTTSSGTNNNHNRNQTILSFYTVSSDANAVIIKHANDVPLSDFGGGGGDFYCGYTGDITDGGNPFYIYKKVSAEVEQIPVTGNFTQGYAAHNSWHKNTGNNANGDLFYTGLAGEFLKSNGHIMFNVPEGGIFSYDASKLSEENGYFDGVKNVYEFVGMPFVMSDTEGFVKYTFDSDENGVYFKDTNNDGTPDPAPGTATQYNNLFFNRGVAQDLPLQVGDGSRNGWFPYNINTSNQNNLIYHFGMRADLPFSMTSNGRIKETDDNSHPIEFTFSGDDDVWIYIDGRLVVDLGGIHNRFDITINFAENTVVYSEENGADNNNETGSFNDPTFSTTQKLFNENGVEGLLGITRQEFATSTDHTMQFFYLERGRGTSNCRIEFNLPMIDSVLVTKEANKSWSATLQEEDEAAGNGGDGTRDLTPGEQASVDNLLFGFTLYKMEGSYFDENGNPIENPDFTPVANTKYYVLDETGTVMLNENGSPVIDSTDGDGRFHLQNGRTAKFMTDMPGDGVTYYLVEDELPDGFLTPDYKYAGRTAKGFEYTGTKMAPITGETIDVPWTFVSDAADMGEHELPMDAEENKSYIITAKGSIQAADTLQFVCVNYLEHNTDAARAHANEDIIVIDYGLPVQIDPLANDIIRGEFIESVEIAHIAVGDHNFDLDGDGVITVEETAALNPAGDVEGHSGTFKFHKAATAGESAERDTFTYTLNKQLTEVEVLTYLVKVIAYPSEYSEEAVVVYGQAKLYVVPATIMYYEEDFSDLVKFTFGNGASEPSVMKDDSFFSQYQEPGVVGTIDDSTYGSDVAYLEDSEDSNGTSYFFDTTAGFVRFQYTFTGTGTTFFARTSAKTGYMQVLLFEGEIDNPVAHSGEQIDTWYRDTYYNDTNNTDLDGDTLYNIPVYTNEGLDYGTYTVVVTVAKAGTIGAGPNLASSGNEFYLDGIRIMQPLNEFNETVINEETGETITDKALSAYATDGESNLEVVTLRQKLITDVEDKTVVWDGENFVVLTDTNGAITAAEDYVSIGPKEEVYLAQGQKVTFSLKYWEPEGLKLYMGMKAPFGTGALNVGSTAYSLKNATDCYYDVTTNYASLNPVIEQVYTEDGCPLYTDAEGEIVIKIVDKETGEISYSDEEGNPVEVNAEDLQPVMEEYYVVTYTFEATDRIVSLTNIKVVGNFEFAIVEDTNIEIVGPEGE